jgi:hypothetical protein
VNFNSSFSAFFKSYFVSISELEDFFVGGVVMNLGLSCGKSMENVLSQKVFIIQSIKVASFSFIREFWRIEHHFSIRVGPSTVEVPIDS